MWVRTQDLTTYNLCSTKCKLITTFNSHLIVPIKPNGNVRKRKTRLNRNVKAAFKSLSDTGDISKLFQENISHPIQLSECIKSYCVFIFSYFSI